ncbi:hypothetical protein [Motilibacter aurantiacus]|uniref:hypothetical protein n=1 Tax=Motilibacter aurantiacus TaxID=2714955 RepID=UPI00140B9841|nr:hypothetical protein [Motilibacter aurantiacus]NHC45233.1 hypothetical protein [Motilibacter aurantiacus]
MATKTTGAAATTASDLCMGLLAAGLPLALICDLTDPYMATSRDILEHEGRPEVAWWQAG